MLSTRITERFGLKYPILSAPMSLHSGGLLAGAVSRAGGLGLFGGIHPAGPSWLRDEIAKAREQCGERPFGIGFITHLLPVFPGMLEAALEQRVPVVAFSFADPGPFVAAAHDAGATVLCQVQTPASARQAVAAGTDVLVAQGNEAGGHTGRANLLPLLQHLLREYPQVPVLAAGGIGDGRGLAAVLAAGADGAWLGTAFLATPECVEVSADYKARLVAACRDDTVYTSVFDLLDQQAFGIPPWPAGIAARLVRNGFTDRWHGRETELARDVEEQLPGYRDALARHDVAQTAVLAGESVDCVTAVRPAAEVVQAVCDQAERLLAAASAPATGGTG